MNSPEYAPTMFANPTSDSLTNLPNWMSQPAYQLPNYGQDFGSVPSPLNIHAGAQPPGGGWSSLDLQGKMGVIGQGVSAFGTLASIYSGFKALDLAEDQFSFQKKAWNKNYNNQVKDYQNQLKDRWAAWNSAASARGNEFASMADWVGSRELTGKETQSVRGGSSSQDLNQMSRKERRAARRNGG